MQLEWNKWIEGMTAFKTGQGMLWIFCLILFVLLWYRGELKHRLFVASIVLGILTICPVTAVVLLKIYTPFYDWSDLQQILPMMLLLAVLGVEAFGFLKDMAVPGLRLGQTAKNIISGVCVVILFMAATNFHGFDERPEANTSGVPVETAEVFEALYDVVGDQPIVLAAPGEILQYTRLFEADWQPLYGRDLWSAKAASYINSGYDTEYEYYTLLGKAEPETEEYDRLTALINEEQVDCVIVPYYWLEEMGDMSVYEPVVLTDIYTGIIKKDLIIK